MAEDKKFSESDFRKVERVQRGNAGSFVHAEWNSEEKRLGYFQGAVDIITIHGKAALHHTLFFDKNGDLREMELKKVFLAFSPTARSYNEALRGIYRQREAVSRRMVV